MEPCALFTHLFIYSRYDTRKQKAEKRFLSWPALIIVAEFIFPYTYSPSKMFSLILESFAGRNFVRWQTTSADERPT